MTNLIIALFFTALFLAAYAAIKVARGDGGGAHRRTRSLEEDEWG